MKSIKQQYIDLREGNMTQANFMRSLRMSLPQYITNLSSFEDSVRILKNKGILTEADIRRPEDDDIPAIYRMYNSDAWVDAQKAAGESSEYDDEENINRKEDEYDDYDTDYEEPNEPFDMAEILDPTAAEEIAKAAGSYEAAVDKLMDMGLSSQEADKIANELYPEEEEYDEDEAAEAERVNMMIDQGLEDRFDESLNEAKDGSSEGKWKTVTGKDLYAHFKEIDNLNAQEVLIGIDYEMQKNEELTKAEAQKIVIKNLKKNPIYYTSEDMSGVEGYEPEYMGGKSAQPEAHQMQYLDKNMGNVVDKKRGMQPVKGVEKAKKDSDKGGETNKAVKGIDLMSLIAKTVRGMKKMDATGEKMKKITMKEAKARFMGMKADADKYKIKKDIKNNIIQATNEDGVTFSKNDTASFKGKSYKITGFKEEQSKVKAIVNNEMFASGIDIDGLEKGKQEFRPGVALGQDKSKLTKERLMKMIREELNEMFDGMEPMDRTGLDNN